MKCRRKISGPHQLRSTKVQSSVEMNRTVDWRERRDGIEASSRWWIQVCSLLRDWVSEVAMEQAEELL